MSDYIDNKSLRRYFSREVALNGNETRRSRNVVNGILNDLFQNLSEYDQLFEENLEPVGSFPAGLKVNKPDEFDFEVPIRICSRVFAELHWYKKSVAKKKRYYTVTEKGQVRRSQKPLGPQPPGYCHVQLRQECSCHCDCEDVRVDQDIVPCLVKQRMRKSLKKAINNLNLRDLVKVAKQDHGPTITIYIKNINNDLPVDQVKIDLAPTLHLGIPIPPNSAWLGWPRRGARWPSKTMVREIQEKGVNFVGKKSFYWLVSFADDEVLLSNTMDDDGGCRKKVHRIMKNLNIREWSQCDEPEDLSSYCLKNVLFWMCEKYWHSDQWSNFSLADRFNDTINYLLECLDNYHIPQYFCPQINLLANSDRETLDEIAWNIRSFLQYPRMFWRMTVMITEPCNAYTILI